MKKAIILLFFLNALSFFGQLNYDLEATILKHCYFKNQELLDLKKENADIAINKLVNLSINSDRFYNLKNFERNDQLFLSAAFSASQNKVSRSKRAFYFALKGKKLENDQASSEATSAVELMLGVLYAKGVTFEKSHTHFQYVDRSIPALFYLASILDAKAYELEGNQVKAYGLFKIAYKTGQSLGIYEEILALQLVTQFAADSRKYSEAFEYALRLEELLETNKSQLTSANIQSDVVFQDYILENQLEVFQTIRCVNYNMLGVLSNELKEPVASRNYYELALKSLEQLANKQIKATVLVNTGLIYSELNEHDAAKFYFEEALNYSIMTKDEKGTAMTYNLLAKNSLYDGNFSKAIENVNKSLGISKLASDLENEADSYLLLSEIYAVTNELVKSQRNLTLYNQAISGSERFESQNNLLREKQINLTLKLEEDVLTELSNEEKDALERVQFDLLSKQREQEILLLKKDGDIRDKDLQNQLLEKIKVQQLLENERQKLLALQANDEITRQKSEAEMFQLASQEAQISLNLLTYKSQVAEQRQRLQQAALKRQKEKQKFYNLLAIAGASIAFLLLLGLYRFFRQNRLISKNNDKLKSLSAGLQNANQSLIIKNDEIEKSNKFIIESINYAKRLQKAIMVSSDELKTAYLDASTLLMPKDIVSGDFLFHKETEDFWYTALGDCTGHGVPGAMLTIFCYEELSRIIEVNPKALPSFVLNTLNTRFASKLNKANETEIDGADIIMLRKSKADGSIIFFSARGRACLVGKKGLISIESEKFSVGEGVMSEDSKDQELIFEKGDSLFMYSDGCIDQQISEDFNKIGKRRFQNLIEGIAQRNPEDISFEIQNYFRKWKDNFSQTDDASVMMLKL